MGRWSQARHKGGGGTAFVSNCPPGLLPGGISAVNSDPDIFGEVTPAGGQPTDYFTIVYQGPSTLGPFTIIATAPVTENPATFSANILDGLWFTAATAETEEGTGCISAQATPVQAT